MMKTGSTKSANSDIELICVAIIVLREVIEERYIATPPANSANEPQSTRQAPLLRLILVEIRVVRLLRRVSLREQ